MEPGVVQQGFSMVSLISIMTCYLSHCWHIVDRLNGPTYGAYHKICTRCTVVLFCCGDVTHFNRLWDPFTHTLLASVRNILCSVCKFGIFIGASQFTIFWRTPNSYFDCKEYLSGLIRICKFQLPISYPLLCHCQLIGNARWINVGQGCFHIRHWWASNVADNC